MKSNLQTLLLAVMVLVGSTCAKAQTITTVAGTGVAGYTGDGGPATMAEINNPYAIAEDGSGNLYFTDYANNRIRKINSAGIVTTVAGTGAAGFSGDGGPAALAQINGPYGISVDIASGSIYFADKGNNRVRKISTTGIISTIAGNGMGGYSGDAGPGTAAALNNPSGIAADGTGVYIADKNNHRIRCVDASGIITTKVGTGMAGFSGDGGPASAAALNNPIGVALNGFSDIIIADYSNNKIRKVSSYYGTINTIAGNGTAGFSGDGGPGTAAQINLPTGVAADNVDNVYIADNGNNRVRRLDPSAIISTFAGTGTMGYSGDGGVASSAMVSAFNTGVLHGGNYVYICGGSQSRIRGVDTGIVSPITGLGTVCVGSTITLSDATPGGVWSSSTPSIATISATTAIVTGITPGTVVITYTVGTSFVNTLITVTSGLTITASAAYAACGGLYTLTASGGTTYSWSPSTGLSCITCSSTTIDPTATTTFTVTGTTGGCSGTATVTIDGNRITGAISPTMTGSVRVWLVHFNPIDSSIIATDSTMACTSGGTMYYEFMDPAGGSYLVKAYELGGTPGTSGYIPTYGYSAPHWDSGTSISHTTATDNQDIVMLFGTVPSGPGFISGYVVSGAGNHTSPDVPAVNMLVYLEDITGHIITYTYTNTAGAYSFGSLANGSYIIYPEAYKYYTTHSSFITLSTSHETAANIDFKQHTSFGTITPVTTNSVLPAVTGTALYLYPNPTSGDLNIEWNIQTMCSADVVLTDMTGRVVIKTRLDINTTKGQTVIDLSGIEEGVYIITIKSGSINYCGRVVRE